MLEPLPKLADYDISAITGFLPPQLPLTRLPEYFAPWERIASELPALILTKRIRDSVDKMPLLDHKHLNEESEWMRATSILGFLAHAYVWSTEKPSDRIPSQLSIPWVAVNEHFDMPPIASYAGLCLWNFRTVLPTEPKNWNLDSLATITTYTGSIDESWFYLVSVTIERVGAPCLESGLKAIEACRIGSAEDVERELRKIAAIMRNLSSTLKRMSELCLPQYFYSRLRRYLSGWCNMGKLGLPNGVYYGDEKTPRSYSGGSNAQSSLIQALDIILNVYHYPFGKQEYLLSEKNLPDRASQQDHPQNFLRNMRKYMPQKHRGFLQHLERVCCVREFVVDNISRNPSLSAAYNACVNELHHFRNIHIQIVSRFIIMPSRAENSSCDGLASNSDQYGTGGTVLLPFLKQSRDETRKSSLNMLTNQTPSSE